MIFHSTQSLLRGGDRYDECAEALELIRDDETKIEENVRVKSLALTSQGATRALARS